jgi:hypothetical protein
MIFIVNNAQDVEEHYPYKNYKKPENYPTKYPCIMINKNSGGGLMGEYYETVYIYCPEGFDFLSFVKGFEIGYNDE